MKENGLIFLLQLEHLIEHSDFTWNNKYFIKCNSKYIMFCYVQLLYKVQLILFTIHTNLR